MSEPTREEIARVGRLLEERGITLIRGDRFYGDELTTEGVLYFLEHSVEEFNAWVNGITLEEYRSWFAFCGREFYRCRGATKGRRRCRNRVLDGHNVELDPSRFRPGVSDRCPLHQEPGVTTVWDGDPYDSPFNMPASR